MKQLIIFLLIMAGIISCKTSKIDATANNTPTSVIKGDTVTIANKDLEYQVIIIDPGFTNWLNSRAFPRGYHNEAYLEGKNRRYVTEWNNRTIQTSIYDPKLYEMQINYDNNIHYGYEVNYLIYNYMIYFQNTYKQKLFGFVPPR